MRPRLSLLALLAVGLCACGQMSVGLVPTGAPRFPPLDPAEVKLYAGDGPAVPRAVIAPLAVDELGDGPAAADAIKREAASLGADAVVQVRLTKMHGFALRTGVSGIAVRFRP